MLSDQEYLNDIQAMVFKLREKHGNAPKRKREEDSEEENPPKRQQFSQEMEMTANYIHICHVVSHVVAGIIIASGMAGFLRILDGTVSMEVILRNLQSILNTSTVVLTSSRNVIMDIVANAFNGLGPQFALVGITTHTLSTGKPVGPTLVNSATAGIQGMDSIVQNVGNIRRRFQSTFTGRVSEFDQFYDTLQSSIADSLIHCQSGEVNARLIHNYLKPVYEWLLYGDEVNQTSSSSSSCTRSVWRELSQTVQRNMQDLKQSLQEKEDAEKPMEDEGKQIEKDNEDEKKSMDGAGVKKHKRKFKAKSNSKSKAKAKTDKKKKTVKHKKNKKRNSIKKRR